MANFEFPPYTEDEEHIEVLLNAAMRRGVEGRIAGVMSAYLDSRISSN